MKKNSKTFADSKKSLTFAHDLRRKQRQEQKKRHTGALVQLVRIHACHAWGHGFESRTHRQKPFSYAERLFCLCLLDKGSLIYYFCSNTFLLRNNINQLPTEIYHKIEQQNFILYKSSDGNIKVSLFARDGSVWLTNHSLQNFYYL